jgi:hypothetical protein
VGGMVGVLDWLVDVSQPGDDRREFGVIDPGGAVTFALVIAAGSASCPARSESQRCE